MELGCGMSTIKYLLFIFNFIFSISGIAIIVIGAVAIVQSDELNQFSDGRVTAAAVVIIVTGVVVFFVASLGCFGAIKESSALLISFTVAILIILIIELASGIAVAIMRGQFGDALKIELNKTLKSYKEKNNQKAWDTIQMTLQCCGVESAKDWDGVLDGGNFPQSCCKSFSNDAPCDAETAYKDGCTTVMIQKFHDSSKLLIGVGIGLAFIEISGVVLGCLLASAIRKAK